MKKFTARRKGNAHFTRDLIASALILYTAAFFSEAENFTPLTEPEIAAVYAELKADFEENPIFKNENINLYRDGIRSTWAGHWIEAEKDPDDPNRIIPRHFVETNNASRVQPGTIEMLRKYKMVDYRPFLLAMQGRNRILAAHKKVRTDLMIVIDFSESDHYRRFFAFDLKAKKVLYNYWTSHGSKSDLDHDGYAEKFSNNSESNESSVGFSLTAETYDGQWGYSLRLDGIDGDLNSKMRSRRIVMHGWGMSYANYVLPFNSEASRRSQHGVRSMGCFMLSATESGRFYGLADKPYAELVIDDVKGGTIIYTHTEVYDMEKTSKWLKPGDAAAAPLEQ